MNSDGNPLLMTQQFLDATFQDQDSQNTIAEDDPAGRLRSHDNAKAPGQLPEFYQFVYALTESYNDEPLRILGLEKALNPLIFLDPVSKRFEVRNDFLTMKIQESLTP